MVKIGQNGPKKLGNFRGFLKIILGKFLDFAGFLGDFFKLRVGSPGVECLSVVNNSIVYLSYNKCSISACNNNEGKIGQYK